MKRTLGAITVIGALMALVPAARADDLVEIPTQVENDVDGPCSRCRVFPVKASTPARASFVVDFDDLTVNAVIHVEAHLELRDGRQVSFLMEDVLAAQGEPRTFELDAGSFSFGDVVQATVVIAAGPCSHCRVFPLK